MKITKQKKPFNEKQIKILRSQILKRGLEELLFEIGLCLMLRSSDLLKLTWGDLLTRDLQPIHSLVIKQQKTNHITIELPLSARSRELIASNSVNKSTGAPVFCGQKSSKKPITIQHHDRLVKKWARELGVDNPKDYGTHSVRRTKPSILYDKTKNIEEIRLLLGHQSIEVTKLYLGVDKFKATNLAKMHEI